MSRIALYVSIATLSVVTWFVSNSELANFIAIGMMLVVGIAAMVMIFLGRSRRAWGALALLSTVSVAVMVACVISVQREADSVAREFLSRHHCRPGIEDLMSDSAWKLNSQSAEKTIVRFGAVRRISYQGNGLLRYGFLHDKQRTVWLPACK